MEELDIKKIADKIDKLANLPPREKMSLAKDINMVAKKYDIPTIIILAILKVESDFNQNAVSPTNDFSIAQVNYNVWKREFQKQGIDLSFERLINDKSYALEKMAKILVHERKLAPDNPNWYIHYHSKTPKFFNLYKEKIDKVLKILE